MQKNLKFYTDSPDLPYRTFVTISITILCKGVLPLCLATNLESRVNSWPREIRENPKTDVDY